MCTCVHVCTYVLRGNPEVPQDAGYWSDVGYSCEIGSLKDTKDLAEDDGEKEDWLRDELITNKTPETRDTHYTLCGSSLVLLPQALFCGRSEGECKVRDQEYWYT